MTLGRVLLVSALLHAALLLAPIPPPSPPAPPAAPLVWMQLAAPSSPAAPPPAPAAPVAPLGLPSAPSSTRPKIRARALPDARARAAPAHADATAIELPSGDPAGAAGASSPGPVPTVPRSLLSASLPSADLPSALPPAFDVRAYGEHVRRRIDAHKQYPARARRLALAGVATVIVSIDARGHLARPPRLARSSGVAALDDEALRMARAAAPFPPPNPDARPTPLVIHVPVRFSLTDPP